MPSLPNASFRLGKLLPLGAALLCSWCGTTQAADMPDIEDMSLEQLGDVRITSVSRRSERLQDAAASVFVVGAEQIRRSGVRTLPEALRLAPNLHVAQTSSTGYVVSARGLNNAGNKMLMLIDGRIERRAFMSLTWKL